MAANIDDLCTITSNTDKSIINDRNTQVECYKNYYLY